MNIEIINPIEYRNWDELLHTTDQSCFFHTSAWAEVLHGAYGYKPLYFSVIEDDHLVGLIPVMEINSLFTGRRGVSLPFTDSCPPIARDSASFQIILGRVIEYGKDARWKCLELKGGRELLHDPLANASYCSHTLTLDRSAEKTFKLFRGSTRRNIRKAELADLNVEMCHDKKSLKIFYQLHCLTRKYHGLPPQPWSFFKSVFEYVIDKSHGFVLLALHGGKAIAGAVHFVFRNEVLFKYGAFDRRFQHLRPNNLVMWEAIKWCCENGIRSFNLGRTELENKGLIQFKHGWGTNESTLRYFNYDIKKSEFSSNGVQLKSSYGIFKIMPPPLLRFAGDLIYRHIG